MLRAASQAGLAVHIWVVNSPRAALGLLERGVDGVMSDTPGELYGLFADFRRGVVR